MRIVLILFCITLIFFSACHKTHMVDCSADCFNPRFGFQFLDYRDYELDTIIVRKYKNDSSFTTQISEELAFIDSPIHDGNIFLDNVSLVIGYDYELILSAVNDTYRISRASAEQRSEERQCSVDHIRPPECENYFHYDALFITRNNVPYHEFTFQSYGFASHFIVLKK